MRNLFLLKYIPFLLLSIFLNQLHGDEKYTFRPENPISVQWLEKNLKTKAPRLIFTEEVEKILVQKIKSDEVVKENYKLIKKRGNYYLGVPGLERKKIGKRLLSVSREAIARVSTLALLYRMENDLKYLERLEAEVNNVCDFTDWNPSHFLDVAEMAFAVSLGLDWCGESFEDETVKKAKKALKEKALLVSFKEPPFGWITAPHNWNQVCHGGLSAAALVLADDEPELAVKTLSRTLNNLHYALEAYAPDGAFLEGASYWFYATYYTTILSSMFESALNTDFNIPSAPGLLESARYSLLTIAPSGLFYNYFDSGSAGAMGLTHQGIMNWFDQKDPTYTYYSQELYLAAVKKLQKENGGYDRFSPITLIWLSQNKKSTTNKTLPECWVGRGLNPLAIMRATEESKSGFYLAAKGGRATLNHGNMDAGSFIFELNGIRWSIDPGNQGYHGLEQILGSGLWQRGQESPRWTLLTKNNFGHSTLSVNDQMHFVNGSVPVTSSFCDVNSPSVSFDLTDLFFGSVNRAERSFVKINDAILADNRSDTNEFYN